MLVWVLGLPDRQGYRWHRSCSTDEWAGQMRTVIAHIDSDLSDLIPGFLANKRSDASVILSALSSGHIDFDTLARIGHKLKGEGGSYGLNDITLYGAEIEVAAHNHDAAAVRRCADELAEYLDSVRIEYE